jgi:M6 family metalloprotease-like protein
MIKNLLKRQKIIVLLIIILSTQSLTSVSAAVKEGSKCSKVGATTASAGKKYTCLKSGKKLVWSKGITIKVTSKPTSTAIPIAKSQLAADSRITAASALTNLDICKTEDKTPYFLGDGILGYGNGFPRADFTISGKKTAKVLVVPMAFKNLPFTDNRNQPGSGPKSDLEQLTEVIPTVESSFKTLSANKFEVNFDILPKVQWWTFNTDSPFSTEWGVPHTPALEKILANEKMGFSFKGYDTVVFATGNGILGRNKITSAQAGIVKTKNSDSDRASVVFMIGALDRSTIWVHELGHSLFGLEDLYPFSDASAGRRTDRTSGTARWDLMADSSETVLLQWNRFLMGWLDDFEVRCISEQSSSIHYLARDYFGKDPKLLTVNLSPGVTLAAEAKPGSSSSIIDGSRLLLYTINTHIESGAEPIVVQNTLFSRGETASMLGWTFNVLDSDDAGILIEVVKTDINKFIPPAPKPRPTQSSSPSSKIKVEKGEVLSAGLLKARATWYVMGHESYRVYVIAADDDQKVFFESGVRNNSQNPIVVDISGLPCNREIRVVTMFFSEKDGKGERMVRDNNDLTILACEDTTKKP